MKLLLQPAGAKTLHFKPCSRGCGSRRCHLDFRRARRPGGSSFSGTLHVTRRHTYTGKNDARAAHRDVGEVLQDFNVLILDQVSSDVTLQHDGQPELGHAGSAMHTEADMLGQGRAWRCIAVLQALGVASYPAWAVPSPPTGTSLLQLSRGTSFSPDTMAVRSAYKGAAANATDTATGQASWDSFGPPRLKLLQRMRACWHCIKVELSMQKYAFCNPVRGHTHHRHEHVCAHCE
eukprot:94957-Pelagomonas_calceolata.AAC.3